MKTCEFCGKPSTVYITLTKGYPRREFKVDLCDHCEKILSRLLEIARGW